MHPVQSLLTNGTLVNHFHGSYNSLLQQLFRQDLIHQYSLSYFSFGQIANKSNRVIGYLIGLAANQCVVCSLYWLNRTNQLVTISFKLVNTRNRITGILCLIDIGSYFLRCKWRNLTGGAIGSIIRHNNHVFLCIIYKFLKFKCAGDIINTFASSIKNSNACRIACHIYSCLHHIGSNN